jgi:hypothetical protein
MVDLMIFRFPTLPLKNGLDHEFLAMLMTMTMTEDEEPD